MDNFFEKGNARINYIKISLPLTLSLLMTVVYNMADTYFISFSQNTDLVAGVSICAPVMTFLMAFGNIFGMGSSSVVSRLIGGNNKEATRRTSAFGFYLSIITGVVLGGLLLIAGTPILHLLGSDADTINYAREYYTWLAIGAPFIVCNFVHTNLMRSEGLSTLSMVASIGGIVVNIVLDPIFITTLKMGAKGAAIATVIGYIFTVVFCLVIVSKKSKNLSVDIRLIKIKKEHFKQMIGIGTSAALTNIMQSICYIVINQYLLTYGNTYIAAMGVVTKISMLSILILTGFTFGCQPSVGYYYGAGKHEEMKKLIRFIMLFTCAIALALTLILEITAPYIFRIFLNDPAIVSIGAMMLRLTISSTIFMNLVFLITVLFQATGKVKESLIMSILRQGLVFILAILVLHALFGYIGVIIAQPAADLITCIIAVIMYRSSFH